ncbi:hypothetical protein [Spirillospora sp. NPDC048819]
MTRDTRPRPLEAGALVLGRAARDTRPLNVIADVVAGTLRAELP